MHVIGLAAAAVAALIHAWFFVLESVWFMWPTVYRRFGIASEADAKVVRSFAFNQGFYNLFLAAGVAIGIALVALREPVGGEAILLFALGSMIGAGVVLFLHNPRYARAAAIQVIPPLIAVVAILTLP